MNTAITVSTKSTGTGVLGASFAARIDTMDILLVRKAFDVPRHLTQVHEPEDVEAPDITNPTRPWYWFQAQKVQQGHYVQQAQQP